MTFCKFWCIVAYKLRGIGDTLLCWMMTRFMTLCYVNFIDLDFITIFWVCFLTNTTFRLLINICQWKYFCLTDLGATKCGNWGLKLIMCQILIIKREKNSSLVFNNGPQYFFSKIKNKYPITVCSSDSLLPNPLLLSIIEQNWVLWSKAAPHSPFRVDYYMRRSYFIYVFFFIKYFLWLSVILVLTLVQFLT